MRLTIARKIYLLLAIAILALLGIATISYWTTNSIVNRTNKLITIEAAQQNQSMEALEKLGDAVHSSRNIAVHSPPYKWTVQAQNRPHAVKDA